MSVGGKCRHGFVRIWHVLDKSARWSLGIIYYANRQHIHEIQIHKLRDTLHTLSKGYMHGVCNTEQEIRKYNKVLYYCVRT